MLLFWPNVAKCKRERYLGHVGQRDVALLAADPNQEGGFESRLIEAREGLSGGQWLKLGGS